MSSEYNELGLRYKNPLGLFAQGGRLSYAKPTGVDILDRPQISIETFYGIEAENSWDGHNYIDCDQVVFFTLVDFLYVPVWDVLHMRSDKLGTRVGYDEIVKVRPDLQFEDLIERAFHEGQYQLLMEIFFSAFELPAFQQSNSEIGGRTNIESFDEIDEVFMEKVFSVETDPKIGESQLGDRKLIEPMMSNNQNPHEFAMEEIRKKAKKYGFVESVYS